MYLGTVREEEIAVSKTLVLKAIRSTSDCASGLSGVDDIADTSCWLFEPSHNFAEAVRSCKHISQINWLGP